MANIEKRFQLLLTDEELSLLKKEAAMRQISAGELIRLSLRNEITHKSAIDRIQAIKTLFQLKRQ
ncbi:MAG: CopG family transcriptional regulator [Leptospira sp.]|nr:CopG family transcriptional regulator [Leptospira sp.]